MNVMRRFLSLGAVALCAVHCASTNGGGSRTTAPVVVTAAELGPYDCQERAVTTASPPPRDVLALGRVNQKERKVLPPAKPLRPIRRETQMRDPRHGVLRDAVCRSKEAGDEIDTAATWRCNYHGWQVQVRDDPHVGCHR